MARYLIRSNCNLLQNFSPTEFCNKRYYINNGGMLFGWGISKLLYDEGDSIRIRSFLKDITDEEIEKINSEYDYFILPLADYIYDHYISIIVNFNNILDKIKIPVICTSLAVKQKYDGNFNISEKTRKIAYEFCKKILEHSSMFGARGEYSAEYFKSLGFKEDRDFMTVGCQSMFMNGPELKLKQIGNIDNNIKMAINQNTLIPMREERFYLYDFFENIKKEFPDYKFFLTRREDANILNSLNNGKELKESIIELFYPMIVKYKNDFYKIFEKSLFCGNAPTWFNELQDRELCVGSRVHGTIAAIVNKIPSYVITYDKRMEELCLYNNIPFSRSYEINENTDIRDLLEKADLYQVQNGYKERFYRFIDFLNKNGLKTIWDNGNMPNSIPFDKLAEERLTKDCCFKYKL